MTRRRRLSSFAACAALLLSACASAPTTPAVPGGPPPSGPPPVQQEFRGVWVATVGNIDWPSTPGLTKEQQQAELIAIMDRAVALRLNAVIFQVRTQGDALYESSKEPWSEFLTGTQGKSPGYDPLAFAIEAAHARGLELHAWFNPYRARTPAAKSEFVAPHLTKTHPELVRTYGTHLWMDPGEPAVREHSIDVITDVARRYDVDGIHIDDYFYPYRELDAQRREIDFPDSASYARYVAAGGKLAKNDWRRENVNLLVRELNERIHQVKPYVRFGVSPIGMWRPGYPAEGCCFDAYEEIYADSRLWFARGWMDYFVPQLYRTMSDTLMNYGVMLGWWGEQNESARALYPGLIPNSVRSGNRPRGWPPEEIVGQIFTARGHPAATGHVHFSARSLMQNDSLQQLLARTVYRYPAITPPSPWLHGPTPAEPSASLATDGKLTIEPQRDVRLYVVQWKSGRRWQASLVPVTGPTTTLTGNDPVREAWVSAVNVAGNQGPARRVEAR